MTTRFARSTWALAGALALAAGCKKDEPGPLGSLTSAGLPNSFETGASRHGGHYMVSLYGAGTFHLAPKGTLWEKHDVTLARIFRETLADGRNYAAGSNGVVYRQEGGAWVPLIEGIYSTVGTAPTAVGATPSGEVFAATEEFAGSTTTFYRFFRMKPGDTQWTKRGEGFAPAVGRLAITSAGRIVGWVRSVGLIELDSATAAPTTLVACGHASLTEGDCKDYSRPVIADRQGNLVWPNSLDGNGYEVALWKLAPGQTEPTQIAGPALPKLQKSSGGFNLYRPGGPDGLSLYVDGSNRVWMAFRWGENVGSDQSYLYRTSGSGWEFQRDDLSRNPRLFGDGQPPAVTAIDSNDFIAFELP
ncbi:MAG: hypothetical protein U0229_23555 [Anaeromyxobacter sp.]